MSTPQSQLVEEILPKIMNTVRRSVGLAGQDVNFYKSLDKEISSELDQCSDRILDMIKRLVHNISEDSNDSPDIDADMIKNSWKDVGDVLDGLFEKSDITYDDYKRSSDSTKKGQSSTSQMTYLEDSSSQAQPRQPSKRIEKPQLKFKKPIDNSESGPFVPKLTNKPNALKPLEESIQLTEATAEVPSHHPQPYETEIDQQEYPESILVLAEPIPSQNWHETHPIWVDNLDSLQQMISELEDANEIAVDLEHHDYRTYYGIVCLMQISNREKDWIVDTLALRDDLTELNTVFTNPQIIKVFHGAFMDIVWLQRDLGLYIVSLFDTYHASRLLGFPKHSLAYLLERFAHFKTSKKYQLADWRIRPLPDAMMSYARSDTHFLLNIFDQLRNQLLHEDKLKEVLHESRKVAKRRFEYTKFRPNIPTSSVVSLLNEKLEPWRPLMFQYNLPESKRNILIDLYNWRDRIARENDESVRYVMPNQLLASLAASAPTDAHGVLTTGNFIPDYVRISSKEIASIILAAVQRSDDEDVRLMSTVHDAYEKSPEESEVDSQYIRSLHQTFTLLKEKTKDLDKKDESLIKRHGGFIADDNIDNSKKTFAIAYRDGRVVSYDVATLLTRLKLATDNFAEVGKENIIIPAAEIPTAPSPTSEPNEVPAIEMEPEKIIDPNEVIVLRKSNKGNQSRKRAQKEESPVEAFDYNSAKPILSDPSSGKDRSKKRPKKRSFDPYSKESEGPAAPKKVARINSGKTSTFKQKR